MMMYRGILDIDLTVNALNGDNSDDGVSLVLTDGGVPAGTQNGVILYLSSSPR